MSKRNDVRMFTTRIILINDFCKIDQNVQIITW